MCPPFRMGKTERWKQEQPLEVIVTVYIPLGPSRIKSASSKLKKGCSGESRGPSALLRDKATPHVRQAQRGLRPRTPVSGRVGHPSQYFSLLATNERLAPASIGDEIGPDILFLGGEAPGEKVSAYWGGANGWPRQSLRALPIWVMRVK
jgi:hypothetical protein